MKLEVDLSQKFDILGFKISLFTIIVLVILSILVFKMCFKTYHTQEQFSSHEDKIHAYNFNTSWCGYSVKFQPEWEEFTSRSSGLGIVAHDIKCDVDENKEICVKYGEIVLPNEEEPVLTGFPTVIFEVPNSEYPVPYRGERSADAMEDAVKKLLSQ